jgi:hypothetical protein
MDDTPAICYSKTGASLFGNFTVVKSDGSFFSGEKDIHLVGQRQEENSRNRQALSQVSILNDHLLGLVHDD